MSEDEDTEQSTVDLVKYTYSVKLVNRSKKSEFRVYNVRDEVRFTDMDNLRSFIRARFKEFADCDDIYIGYIEPGHGWKGKQTWLSSDEDIKDLYAVCSKVRHILLWCYLPSPKEKKRKRNLESYQETQNKRSRCLASNKCKIDEAGDILQDLTNKHGNKYTPEQLHAWAEMLQMKSHTSREVPPSKPFFKSNHKERENSTSVSSCSPSRIHARTECIEQLQKIGNLLEKGIISQEQHDKLQKSIMKDIL